MQVSKINLKHERTNTLDAIDKGENNKLPFLYFDNHNKSIVNMKDEPIEDV